MTMALVEQVLSKRGHSAPRPERCLQNGDISLPHTAPPPQLPSCRLYCFFRPALPACASAIISSGRAHGGTRITAHLARHWQPTCQLRRRGTRGAFPCSLNGTQTQATWRYARLREQACSALPVLLTVYCVRTGCSNVPGAILAHLYCRQERSAHEQRRLGRYAPLPWRQQLAQNTRHTRHRSYHTAWRDRRHFPINIAQPYLNVPLALTGVRYHLLLRFASPPPRGAHRRAAQLATRSLPLIGCNRRAAGGCGSRLARSTHLRGGRRRFSQRSGQKPRAASSVGAKTAQRAERCGCITPHSTRASYRCRTTHMRFVGALAAATLAKGHPPGHLRLTLFLSTPLACLWQLLAHQRADINERAVRKTGVADGTARGDRGRWFSM